MKFAFLIGGELRGVKKTINNLYKYIIDYYDADVFLLCQKYFEDDEERLSLFNKNVVYSKLYDKPNPNDYFNKEFKETNKIDMVTWNKYENLQIFITMNEYLKVIEGCKHEYDYFINFRTDINMLFPLPEKSIFETVPKGVYMFEFNYSIVWGDQGLCNFIHKDFIDDYLKSCYDFIKNNDINTPLFTSRINIYDYIPDYKSNYSIDNSIMNRGLTSEFLLFLALQDKGIKINSIYNPNFFYTAESLNGRTTKETIKLDPTTNNFFKYQEQLIEVYDNLKLWENNYRWFYDIDNNKILLKNNNTTNIEIDILIPNYNKGEFIEEAILSIFNQKTIYMFNIKICDDCSTDNSIEIINKYIDKYPGKITLIKNEKNIGAFQTTLKLYEIIDSDYFTVLDSDDYWIDNYFIENALTFLEKYNEYTIYANNTRRCFNTVLTTCIYNTDATLNIDFNNLTTMPHTSSTIFRNVVFKKSINNESKKKINIFDKLKLKIGTNCERYYEGESIRVVLHLERGRCFLDSRKIAGVYRINDKGIWNNLNEYNKCLINLKGYIDVFKFFDYEYKYCFLNSLVILEFIQKTLSINEDSGNYDQSIQLYDVFIEYLQLNNNNNKIDSENFLFYDIDNYQYEYNYIFIRIIKLFSYLNKTIYVIDTGNITNKYNANVLHYNEEIDKNINIIIPYNYNIEIIKRNNIKIFNVGEFK